MFKYIWKEIFIKQLDCCIWEEETQYFIDFEDKALLIVSFIISLLLSIPCLIVDILLSPLYLIVFLIYKIREKGE